MPLVAAKCPNCGAALKVDNSRDAAICEFCGNAYVVERAITLVQGGNVSIQAGNVIVNNHRDFVIRAGKLLRYDGESVDVTIPSSVFEIADGTFMGSGIRSVQIPSSVRSIGYEAFMNCRCLVSVILSPGLTEIGSRAFCGCYSLRSIQLPDSLRRIRTGAFYNCANLNTVGFPENVSIEENVFYPLALTGESRDAFERITRYTAREQEKRLKAELEKQELERHKVELEMASKHRSELILKGYCPNCEVKLKFRLLGLYKKCPKCSYVAEGL